MEGEKGRLLPFGVFGESRNGLGERFFSVTKGKIGGGRKEEKNGPENQTAEIIWSGVQTKYGFHSHRMRAGPEKRRIFGREGKSNSLPADVT